MEEQRFLGTDHSVQSSQALADTDNHHRPKPAAFPDRQYECTEASPAFPTPHNVHLWGANSGKSGVNQAIGRDLFALALWQDVDAGLEPEGPACVQVSRCGKPSQETMCVLVYRLMDQLALVDAVGAMGCSLTSYPGQVPAHTSKSEPALEKNIFAAEVGIMHSGGRAKMSR